ncbi:MAG: OpgC domain-containing protein [Hyphomicrobiales bacterium]|nr:OpgC domain-containing protein [Hyphomicrobiales bacterium]MBV8768420.1 OpgC domain-containing protein [Hyphomicrobiales bacterium]MBV9050771.1 OpgC domain-containing protein [Hyphomicrobiales bacterium]MBV9978257.1 OpgC domain-containing protein [Hyphomicrobiales bacterium]
MRAANEIDFWRGFALTSIFINHIPGFYFERFTHRNFGQSDSAELFVFLAGWALRLVVDSRNAPLRGTALVLRLSTRALTIYAAQILITMLALAIIAGASMAFDDSLLLQWNNAQDAFLDPVPTHIGIILLTHQLGAFNILPLYVVLMLGAPVIAVLHRRKPSAVLVLSLALYVAALVFQINFRTWPEDGYWYFNPLTWQLVFVLGFVLARDDGPGVFVRRYFRPLRAIGFALVVVGVVLAAIDFEPDPTRMPDPKLFFVFDKTFATPARVLHFLALAIAFGGSFALVLRVAAPLARFLSMLGRNSLNVFCAGSLLSLCASVARYALGDSIVVDLSVLICGVACLGATAWLSEWRERFAMR